jgi:hypothetical protein
LPAPLARIDRHVSRHFRDDALALLGERDEWVLRLDQRMA